MSLVLPDPDEIRHVPTGTIPLWYCPRCVVLHDLEGYGLRCLNGPAVKAMRERPRYIKQSWCYHCRMKAWGSTRVDPLQPYLLHPLEDNCRPPTSDPDDEPDDWTDYFEGIA